MFLLSSYHLIRNTCNVDFLAYNKYMALYLEIDILGKVIYHQTLPVLFFLFSYI